MAKPLSISSHPSVNVAWRAYFEMTKPKVVALSLIHI